MPFKNKLFVLRVGVMAILLMALLKYMSSSSLPQDATAKIQRKNKDFFWGDNDPGSQTDEEVQKLPPETLEIATVAAAAAKDAEQRGNKPPRKDFTNVQMKLVHLDLKGAAPRISYFKEIFPLLSKMGANGLLIEYEDMFPFSGELEVLKSPHAYSEADIETILHLAEINKLEVVPLVQTFGHMEYVLKHEKHRGLREVERFPNSLNPHNAESLALVKSMLSQVLDKHPASSWIHIGADEVYTLGEGQDSKNWLNANQGNLGKMFANHVKEVAGFLHDRYPEKEQLMWDDMLRKLGVDIVQDSGIPKYISPVLWIYHSDFNIGDIESHIGKYQEMGFKSVWFASAFKGASGVDQLWTPMGFHMKNHQRWKKVIDSMPSKFPKIRFAGIALTGWQRYDHYSVLCELLPVGIPSLAVCLQVLQRGEFNEEAQKESADLLGFNTIDVEKDTCEGLGAFPGAGIYSIVQKIHKELKQNVDQLLEGNSDIRGWFSPYHRKHKFGNPLKMEIFSAKLLKTHEEWETLIQSLRSLLEATYFPDAVEEWMEEHVNPRLDLLRKTVKDFQEILPLNARPKAL